MTEGPPVSTDKLRLALFGSGRFGQVHARNIADHQP